MEVALYPFKSIRITQRHDEGNHLAHWNPKTNYSDKPIDEALENANRGYFNPFNDFEIVDKLGNEKNGYSIRLISCKKLKIPYKSEADYLELTLTHLNKDDFDKIKVGQIIHKNEQLIREGSSGEASGNHFHMTMNIGKYYGFKKNNNGKWVFAYEKSLLPNEAFYIDLTKTKILNRKNYNFKYVNFEIGSCNDDVEKIDNYLMNEVKGNFYGYYSSYGIKAFQNINNLEETGNVDLKTFERLLDKGVKL